MSDSSVVVVVKVRENEANEAVCREGGMGWDKSGRTDWDWDWDWEGQGEERWDGGRKEQGGEEGRRGRCRQGQGRSECVCVCVFALRPSRSFLT